MCPPNSSVVMVSSAYHAAGCDLLQTGVHACHQPVTLVSVVSSGASTLCVPPPPTFAHTLFALPHTHTFSPTPTTFTPPWFNGWVNFPAHLQKRLQAGRRRRKADNRRDRQAGWDRQGLLK